MGHAGRMAPMMGNETRFTAQLSDGVKVYRFSIRRGGATNCQRRQLHRLVATCVLRQWKLRPFEFPIAYTGFAGGCSGLLPDASRIDSTKRKCSPQVCPRLVPHPAACVFPRSAALGPRYHDELHGATVASHGFLFWLLTMHAPPPLPSSLWV